MGHPCHQQEGYQLPQAEPGPQEAVEEKENRQHTNHMKMISVMLLYIDIRSTALLLVMSHVILSYYFRIHYDLVQSTPSVLFTSLRVSNTGAHLDPL